MGSEDMASSGDTGPAVFAPWLVLALWCVVAFPSSVAVVRRPTRS